MAFWHHNILTCVAFFFSYSKTSVGPFKSSRLAQPLRLEKCLIHKSKRKSKFTFVMIFFMKGFHQISYKSSLKSYKASHQGRKKREIISHIVIAALRSHRQCWCKIKHLRRSRGIKSSYIGSFNTVLQGDYLLVVASIQPYPTLCKLFYGPFRHETIVK